MEGEYSCSSLMAVWPVTGQSSPREVTSPLNTSSGSRGEHCTMPARVVPWPICVQRLRQKLKTTLAAMPLLGPVGLIGKTLVSYSPETRRGRVYYQLKVKR